MRDRQSDPSHIFADHMERYRHAAGVARGNILDAACGIGYGSAKLANRGFVTAVDIEPDALKMAREVYADDRIEWIEGDILKRPWHSRKFDTIVSLETLEHLDEPEKVLGFFREALEPNGLLVCSVPNEEKYPFSAQAFAEDKYPHKRHYTPLEFTELLNRCGFEVLSQSTQLDKMEGLVTPGTNGLFLIYTCSPADW